MQAKDQGRPRDDNYQTKEAETVLVYPVEATTVTTTSTTAKEAMVAEVTTVETMTRKRAASTRTVLEKVIVKVRKLK